MLDADLPLACHWLSMAGWLMTYQGPGAGRVKKKKKKKSREKGKPRSRLAKSNQMQISVLSPNAADIEGSGLK